MMLSLDHRLWVAVFDTLHFMAPLLVGHLSFARCHVATESALFLGC